MPAAGAPATQAAAPLTGAPATQAAAHRSPTWLGVDVGGTNIRAGCVDDAGNLTGWVSYPHRMKPGQYHAIEEAADKALALAGCSWEAVAGMGVGIAGLVDSRTGTVLDAGNLGWHGLALGPELSRRRGVPVVILNDVCSSAVAEARALPGGPVSPWLYVSVGTGIGACLGLGPPRSDILCLNAGHLPAPEADQPCPCGKFGCLETVASGAAFTRAARLRIAQDPDHFLHARAGALTGADVVAAAQDGDQVCAEVLARAGRACGRAVADLVNLLLPAGVGLGGGAISPASPYLTALLESARGQISPWMQETFEFHCARLGERAGVVGGVELTRRHLAEDPGPL